MSLGRAVALCIALVWLLRATTEVLYFRIGIDGTWWHTLVFMTLAGVYLVPLLREWPRRRFIWKPLLASWTPLRQCEFLQAAVVLHANLLTPYSSKWLGLA